MNLDDMDGVRVQVEKEAGTAMVATSTQVDRLERAVWALAEGHKAKALHILEGFEDEENE